MNEEAVLDYIDSRIEWLQKDIILGRVYRPYAESRLSELEDIKYYIVKKMVQ